MKHIAPRNARWLTYFDDVETLFTNQRRRIRLQFSRRDQQRLADTAEDINSPLIKTNDLTLCPAGDDLCVTRRGGL